MRQNKLDLRKKFNLLLGDAGGLINRIPDNTIDLTITSPPYFMGKEYDNSTKLEDFVAAHLRLLPRIVEKTKEGGSICWQVGYHVTGSVVSPLDYYIFRIMNEFPNVHLRNRIVWTFGHGLHTQRRFSGRHEVIVWFTKGDHFYFDLDSVRVPQKYPGKKFYKGARKGEFSGNPLGKNPSDVWEIPNVKANHVEKTDHPCQFPVSLAQRLVLSLSPRGGFVLDPFMGVGSTGVASIMEGRKFVGIEIEPSYLKTAKTRIQEAERGRVKYRPLTKPLFQPTEAMAVARKPSTFNY